VKLTSLVEFRIRAVFGAKIEQRDPTWIAHRPEVLGRSASISNAPASDGTVEQKSLGGLIFRFSGTAMGSKPNRPPHSPTTLGGHRRDRPSRALFPGHVPFKMREHLTPWRASDTLTQMQLNDQPRYQARFVGSCTRRSPACSISGTTYCMNSGSSSW
jgi:hypothetical protein